MQKLLVFVIGLLFCAPAFAADQCYTPEQLQAEQLLRLHSELMVITVTCHQGSEGQDLVPAYTGFTRAHIKSLHEAEQTMMHYFKGVFGGNGEERLDKLRTVLGNEYGQKIADISAPVFCERYRDKVIDFYKLTPASLDKEVTTMNGGVKTLGHLCSGSVVAAHGQ